MPVIEGTESAFRCQECGGFRRPVGREYLECLGPADSPHPPQPMQVVLYRGQDETPDLQVRVQP